MILSHTFYPPGWNFPSDTHTQSSQAHTQGAPTHKEATLEINIFFFDLFLVTLIAAGVFVFVFPSECVSRFIDTN